MKLKNKKTGEIGEMCEAGGYITVWLLEKAHGCTCENKNYGTLAEMNEEWEDVPEEPKEYWYLSGVGEIVYMKDDGSKFDKDHKFIGNYFSSREEAEKAVEKLKAWKRLKDKGFSIYSWDYEFDVVNKPAQTIILKASAVNSSNTDLDLLFGGEE